MARWQAWAPRKQGALVVNAADHRLRSWHREIVLRFELPWKRDRWMPGDVAVPIPAVIRFRGREPASSQSKTSTACIIVSNRCMTMARSRLSFKVVDSG